MRVILVKKSMRNVKTINMINMTNGGRSLFQKYSEKRIPSNISNGIVEFNGTTKYGKNGLLSLRFLLATANHAESAAGVEQSAT